MNFKSHILLLLSCFIGIIASSQNIEFIENKGQWDSRVKFMGQISNGAFFVEQNGFTVLQHNNEDLQKLRDMVHGHTQDDKVFPADQNLVVHSHAYNVSFLNAYPKAQISADKPLFTYNNYFIGGDPSKWASNCKIYQGITISNLYPNIDVRYYSDRGTLKYDLIVHPGGQISDIALKYDGVDKLEVKNKELLIGTSVGQLKELAPYTYQYDQKGKNQISAKYFIRDNVVRFNIKDYDRTSTLIIDPTLIFSTFTGSTGENWGFTATYGPDGSMYGGGIVGGAGFPVSTGAFQTSYQGGEWDIGIIKLTPDGTNRVYATYIGGGGIEQPHSLIVDPQGNLIVAGRTNSPSYPSPGAFPLKNGVSDQIGPGGGYDIVIVKLNASGTALIGSKRIGGAGNDGTNIRDVHTGGPLSLVRNYGDDGRSEVNLDGAGNIYLASCTQSTDFPVKNAFQNINNGGTKNQDGVVLKFLPDLSSLLFSSYLGGSGNDAAYVISVNPVNNNIYVAGGTESDDPSFPGPKTGGPVGTGNIAQNNHGSIDGFVSIISNDGSTILRTAFIGTPAIDQIYGLKFDNFGFPYIVGQTTGTWQQINAAWYQPGGKQFIAKLQPDLSAFVYSTMFGTGDGVPNISPVAFLVDRCENVYVSGWGGGEKLTEYPSAGVTGLPVTPNAIKPTPDPSGGDFYFFVLKKNATAQLYGSFFGENSSFFPDHVDGGTSRFDKNGVIYQAICADCGHGGTFPTTPGAWSNVNRAPECNLALVKIDFDLSGVRAGIESIINGQPRDSAGCIPLTVDFKDTIQNAVSYEWNFGDGSPQVNTTAPNISHTFNSIGTFKVMIVAIDSTTCNLRDTAYVHIRVGAAKALLDFNPVKTDTCTLFKYRFDNTSIAPPGFPFNNQTFTWDFGDGSPRITGGSASVFHNYASAGTYNVKLILNDTTYCNSPDSLVKQIRVAAIVKARFETPPSGCAPYTAQFTNTSQAGAQFKWDFGDGGFATTVDASHLYSVPGTYTITLIAIDPATCNVTDTTSYSIIVYGKPTSNFSASPQPPVINTSISFTNLSTPDAVKFKWQFGDGDSLVTTSRNIVQHEYNTTSTYSVCLIAANQIGCADTACKQIQTLIVPAVDVPTAFTPLSGDQNSIVYVRGFGIAKMNFTIWARWGEKVFETGTKHSGWDGRYKGKLLPMDVYAYTLNVEFTDGTKTTKTGDITLIR